jgi:uridine monophosphate synthetase
MVTIHLISGEAALKAIQQWDSNNKPALIPIIEMSSEGALTDNAYAEKCKSFMFKYPEVIGGVCQTQQMEKGFLKFTPGVNLSTAGDGKGQQYNTPLYAIENLGSDFLIIGRGLYLSEQPEKEMNTYLIEIRKSGLFS